MDEHEMSNLWEDLKDLRSVFEEFASASGYEAAEPSSVGRYPTIRLTQRSGDVTRWIQFGMGLDAAGRRFQSLSPLVSYEFGGGAFTDRVVGGKTERYSLRHLVFEGLGINACRSRVSSDLVSLHEVISAWQVDDLLSEGESFPIDAGG